MKAREEVNSWYIIVQTVVPGCLLSEIGTPLQCLVETLFQKYAALDPLTVPTSIGVEGALGQKMVGGVPHDVCFFKLY